MATQTSRKRPSVKLSPYLNMPPRQKRTFEEIVNAEESGDEDYDDRETRPSRKKTRPSKSQRRHARKRVRRSDDDDEDDDGEGDEDDLSEGSHSGTGDEAEKIEINEKGRPIRSAVKARVTYVESAESAEDSAEFKSEDSDEEVAVQKPKRQTRSLMVKLKTGATPSSTPGPASRNTRTSRSTQGGKQPPASAEPHGTRRSSRKAGDDEDTLVALTNSGHHAEVVRAGTRSPDALASRAFKGGKGLRRASKAAVIEEEGQTVEDAPHESDIKASQHEIMESDPQGDVDEGVMPRAEAPPIIVSDVAMVPESDEEAKAQEEDDDDDDVPVQRGRRTRGASAKTGKDESEGGLRGGGSLRRSGLSARATSQRKGQDESSDFEPPQEEPGDDDISASEKSQSSPRKGTQRNDGYTSSNGRRSGRLRRGKAVSGGSQASEHHDSDAPDPDELADELEDLKQDRPRRKARPEIIYEDKPRRRNRQPVDYRLLRPELNAPIEDLEEEAAPTPSRRARAGAGAGGWQRSLFSTYGPFGGAGGPAPVLGGPGGFGVTGGVDSDSSEDEVMQRPKPIGGTVGMTPTAAMPPGFGMFPPAQAHGSDPAQGLAGTPANLGKVKDKQALADADPLGVDQNVNFDSVGGLQGHIDQLKEMVALPLLYPEIFLRFHVTPPRGVLFHGPPGTGKTLLARALASSVSSQGQKVTFYMRKGADALSKWVGEAERQLRLLFEEARKNQPSIIFFDEIDGLAPVRSSKQEQIHASIVSTLLALMDGMDGRGQVIVIGATNRPDSIDPALRRPGRFDREFYFPLPNTEGRRAILDIHTKGWDPPLPNPIKSELAELTKGYGGADLRALCTEAALNAVQRRYPQIYSSNEKLLIDAKTIEVTPKDFMISVKKMIPSSERSTSSGAAPLPEAVEPLLRRPLSEIKNVIAEVLPMKKPLTALEEAQFEEPENAMGFRREKMQQAFETSRVFRPRLLVRGPQGMGQQYLAAALLNHFEGLHVQSFDLPTLLSDSTRSPEATVVQLFSEVKMHKPSVIYIPNVSVWYSTVGPTVISTFLGLLRSLPPTDPVLLLGVLETEPQYNQDEADADMIKTLFGYSRKNQFAIELPNNLSRREFFNSIVNYIRTPPADFPDPANRKKRKLEKLKVAPPPPPKAPESLSKEELKAQKKRDRQTLNLLKIRIQPIMDQIRNKYKKFRTGVVDESQIRYLYEEEDPGTVSSDLPVEERMRATFRPFEKAEDAHGEPGLREAVSGKFYYNLEIVTIEKRLSNGYYKRPQDFTADIKRLAKDAKQIGDQERLLKANELLANVEVDMMGIEQGEPALAAECEKVYVREVAREKEAIAKATKAAEAQGITLAPIMSNVANAHADSGPSSVNPSTGPVVLGEELPNGRPMIPLPPVTPSRPSHGSSNLTNGYTTGGLHGTGTGGGSDLDAPANGPTSNGSSHPSHADGDGDVHMSNSGEHTSEERNTQHSSFGPLAQPRPPHSYTAPSQPHRQASGMSNPLSQQGPITPVPPGSQPADFQNDASTTQTTSDMKTSDPASGPHQLNSQGSKDHGPDFSLHPERQFIEVEGVVPDTQELHFSQNTGSTPRSSQPNGSQPPVPPFDAPPRPRGSIHGLLNDEDETPPTLIIDHAWIEQLHNDLTNRSSGCTVEQLEQINTGLMDCVWKLRGEWNRSLVAGEVVKTFNEVMADISAMQEVLPASLQTRVQLGMQ